MKRRTFLQMIGAAVACCLTGFTEKGVRQVSTELSHPWQPDCPYPSMPFLFRDEYGNIVAAPTLDEAVYYHDVELCGFPKDELQERRAGWHQLPDNQSVTITMVDEPGHPKVTQTAKEWANEMKWVEVVATRDW